MEQQSLAGAYFIRELDTSAKRLYPFPVFNQLRETTPVRYDDLRKCWDVFLYEDVEMILKNYNLFSAKHKRLVEAENILFMDPPRHRHIRNLVSQAFTPKMVQNQADTIQRIAAELLDRVIEQGQMNVLQDFASPLTILMIAKLLGVPPEDHRQFREWSERITKGATGSSEEELQAVVAEHIQVTQELTQFFLDAMEKRRHRPQDDLITKLLQAEIDGEKLTDKEIVDFCILLLVAGNETTANLITNGVRALTQYPELQPVIQEQPSSIPSFVTEAVRFYPSVLGTVRIAKQDTELRGQWIREGEVVSVWIASANRDPRKFSDPDAFQLDRSPNPHLSFSKGIHYCLGASLACLEAELAFAELFSRITDLRMAESAHLQIIPSPPLYGIKEFPLTFQRI